MEWVVHFWCLIHTGNWKNITYVSSFLHFSFEIQATPHYCPHYLFNSNEAKMKTWVQLKYASVACFFPTHTLIIISVDNVPPEHCDWVCLDLFDLQPFRCTVDLLLCFRPVSSSISQSCGRHGHTFHSKILWFHRFMVDSVLSRCPVPISAKQILRPQPQWADSGVFLTLAKHCCSL